MSTTTTSWTEQDSRIVLELEALEAGYAPGLPGDETGERERAGAARPPVTPHGWRPGWSMRPSIGPRTADGSVKLLTCRRTGGSATN
jgi:hypothetical protein